MKGVLEAIDAETEEKAKRILQDARDFAQGKKEEMRKQAEHDNDELFAIEEKSITRHMRKREERVRETNLLETMRLRDRMVNEIWGEVAERFLTMPQRKDEYKAFMDSIFSLVKEQDKFELFMREGDPSFRKGAKRADISGGAVFRSPDGKVEIDFSLDTILADSEESTKAIIAEVLFA